MGSPIGSNDTLSVFQGPFAKNRLEMDNTQILYYYGHHKQRRPPHLH